MQNRLLFSLATVFLLACGDPRAELSERRNHPPPQPPDPIEIPDASIEGGGPSIDASPGVEVEFEPPASPSGVHPITRIRLRLPKPASSSGALLVHGTLSASQLRDIAKGKVANTVSEREVSTLFWVDPDDERTVVASPLVRLVPGETYTMATASPSSSVSFVVGEETLPYLRRVWPLPMDAAASPRFAIYCGSEPLALTPRTISAEPARIEGHLRGGIGATKLEPSACLRWDAIDSSPIEGPLVLPPAIELDDGQLVALDPMPLVGNGSAPELEPVPCGETEVGFGNACLTIEDDRLLVRPSYWGHLVALEAADASLVHVALEGARFLLRPLPPSSLVNLRGVFVDAAGRVSEIEEAITTMPPRARLVLNEVLAAPLGPEPAQEWIEIFNDGLEPAELFGLELDVNGTKTVLPEATLAPGAYALIVSEAFVMAEGSDPPPASGTRLVRVPKLGKQGLTNSGPTITLRNPDGPVLSRFPPTPKPKKGVSVVRIRPDALDELPESFAYDPKGSSSPGAANPQAAFMSD